MHLINKIFNDLIDFSKLQASDFVGFPDGQAFEDYNHSERLDYLEKLGFSIRSYDEQKRKENAELDDDVPF